MKYQTKLQAGFSLVEAVIVAALSVMVFGALFASFHYSLQLINQSRSKLSALAVANDRMEYFRSLPYDDVGTISGIPSGTIPQNSTTSLNGIVFQERVLVEYVDDEADGKDGTATPDSNGIPSDYKRVKVEYTWWVGNATSSVSLISNIVPRSVESTAGGGTVRINVLDENAALLPGASVRLFNNTTTSTIDVTRTSDAGGVALFSGAPAASNYEVEVTANIGSQAYSTDKTYQATTSNPIPILAPFAVLESDVSTLTFQIGELSDLRVRTLSSLVSGSAVDEFPNLDGVASSTNVDTALNSLVLADTLGVYETSGIAYLYDITPTNLEKWESVRVAVDLPLNTSHKVQFFTGSSTSFYTLIPDTDLPGNLSGFTETIINMSDLDATLYSSIVVGITLNTTDTSETPAVDEIGVYYRESETTLGSMALSVRGDKVIGKDLALAPIYKYTNSITTAGDGVYDFSDMEFDTYTFTPPAGQDIASACAQHPFIQQAGINGELELLLVGNAASTLRVEAINSLGKPVPGIDVHLSRAGYDVTEETDFCGQAFFTGGLIDDDYTLEVSGHGYTTTVLNPYPISGDTVARITLTE